MKTKLYFTFQKEFSIDVFLDANDSIFDLQEYVEDMMTTHIRQICFDLMEGNTVTKIGRHVNIYHGNNDSVSTINDDEIEEIISKLREADE